jgi:hypothetical protein
MCHIRFNYHNATETRPSEERLLTPTTETCGAAAGRSESWHLPLRHWAIFQLHLNIVKHALKETAPSTQILQFNMQ